MTKALTTQSAEVAQFFSEHAREGTEDMGAGALPAFLKVTGGLSDNKLLNGEPSKVGRLYHTALKKDFERVSAHILYVRKCRLPNFNKTEQKLNYLVGGFLTVEQVPFVLYIKGLGLQPFWDYQKEMGECIVNQKVPLFAQNVVISSIKRDGNVSGKVKHIDVPLISLEKNAEGIPLYETNLDILRTLQAQIEGMKVATAALVNMADGTEELDEYVDQSNRQAPPEKSQVSSASQLPPTSTEDISDDIPF